MNATLHYFHDPMCSWCYAFARVWGEVQAQLPANVAVRRWLGGLAPDSDQPMADEMRRYLQATWQRIEATVPGVQFNHAFWERCQPRRATYPSCRAVIAARAQGEHYDVAMTRAIQQAYYQQARNPSDDDTLIALAVELGLDVERFQESLNAAETRRQLAQEIDTAHTMGADGYPSLIIETTHGIRPIAVDYRNSQPVLERIGAALG